MKLQAPFSIAALLLSAAGVSGCFEGGGGGGNETGGIAPPPPPPPPPGSGLGGLWSGEVWWDPKDGFPGGALNVRALVAETGEFRLALYPDPDHYFGSQNDQIFGSFDIDDGSITTTGDSIWAAHLGAGNITGDLWAAFGMSGDYQAGESIEGSFHAGWTNFEERVGTLSLNYHSIYERPSSLDILQGIYSSSDESLTIANQGEIFYQSSITGCSGIGAARMIDPDFNMYRLEIYVDGCTGNAAVRNGRVFYGLGSIGNHNDLTGGFLNSTFEMAVSAEVSGPFSNDYIGWSLLVHKN